jgi:hypothetical protein
MKTSKIITVIALVAFFETIGSGFADNAKVNGKKSLESRIAELEAKLKDASVGGGVEGSGIKISGYVDTSYLVNLANRSNTGPVAGSSSQNTGRVFDNQFNAFNLNAVKLTIEKAKDRSKFPAGFRVDALVGEDADVLKNNKAVGATASESSLYLEQAFINLGIPIGNGIDVKVGKMVTLLDYEVVESPANWQFSRSDGYRLSPFTHIGAQFSYAWNDTVTTTAAVINGWDNEEFGVGGGSGNFNTDFSFVGKVDVTGPKTSFGDFTAYGVGLYGNDDPSGTATTLNRATTYIWNVGGNWVKPFGIKEMTWGIDHLYRYSQLPTAAFVAGVQNEIVPVSAHALSVYGKWDWVEWTSTSGRFSATWYGNNRANGVTGNPVSMDPLATYTGSTRPANTELYSFTLTQAFNVWKDTLVRLEWRRDWTPSSGVGFGTANAPSKDDLRKDQDTIAVNVVYSF